MFIIFANLSLSSSLAFGPIWAWLFIFLVVYKKTCVWYTPEVLHPNTTAYLYVIIRGGNNILWICGKHKRNTAPKRSVKGHQLKQDYIYSILSNKCHPRISAPTLGASGINKRHPNNICKNLVVAPKMNAILIQITTYDNLNQF